MKSYIRINNAYIVGGYLMKIVRINCVLLEMINCTYWLFTLRGNIY